MSDNWVVSTLEDALSNWNDKLAEIWSLVSQTPESFRGGEIWTVIVGIHNALVPMTIFHVFVTMRTAQKVLKIHLKNIQVSTSDEYCQDGFSNETVNTLRTIRIHRDFRAGRS